MPVTIWQAGYRFRDEDGISRWSEVEGSPLFSSVEEANLAHPCPTTSNPRPVIVFESVVEWQAARKLKAREKAIAKLKQLGVTCEEMEALGL